MGKSLPSEHHEEDRRNLGPPATPPHTSTPSTLFTLPHLHGDDCQQAGCARECGERPKRHSHEGKHCQQLNGAKDDPAAVEEAIVEPAQ